MKPPLCDILLMAWTTAVWWIVVLIWSKSCSLALQYVVASRHGVSGMMERGDWPTTWCRDPWTGLFISCVSIHLSTWDAFFILAIPDSFHCLPRLSPRISFCSTGNIISEQWYEQWIVLSYRYKICCIWIWARFYFWKLVSKNGNDAGENKRSFFKPLLTWKYYNPNNVLIHLRQENTYQSWTVCFICISR